MSDSRDESTAERVKELLFDALQRAPENRLGFIDAICGGDRMLRERLSRLVRAHEQAGEFLGDTLPAGDTKATAWRAGLARSGTGTLPAMLRQLEALIRDIPDFPKPGILFKDITPLLADPSGLSLAVELMANPFRRSRIDAVVGAESRGFIFGTAIAQSLSVGFIPVRKPGKLPAERMTIEYTLEYGTDSLEMHTDALTAGQRVLMVDDLLATGGTMKACCGLVANTGAEIVGISVLIELDDLHGRDALKPHAVSSVLRY